MLNILIQGSDMYEVGQLYYLYEALKSSEQKGGCL